MKSLLVRMLLAWLIVFMLTIVPLPSMLSPFRPPWVLLLALYIQLFLPNYFKITWLFIVGLLLDSLLSTVMGEHAFCLCLVAWLASGKARRFSFFSMSQQMLFVGYFAISYQVLIVLIDSFFGYHAALLSIVGIGIFSVLLWPWFCLVGQEWLVPASYRVNYKNGGIS